MAWWGKGSGGGGGVALAGEVSGATAAEVGSSGGRTTISVRILHATFNGPHTY